MDSNCLALGNKVSKRGSFFLRYDGSHHLLRHHGTMQEKARRAVVPFIINITIEINFSSKVYSKNLLKVGSL